MKKSSVYLLIAPWVLSLVLAAHPCVYADEPSALGWKVIESSPSGIAVAGTQPGGDAKIILDIFPVHKEIMQKNLLILFSGCGEDPKTVDKPILNLSGILSGKEKSPVYPDIWAEPGPRWRMCPDVGAQVMWSGQSLRMSATVDFLRLASEGMSPRLEGKVYELSQDDVAFSQAPFELALIMEGRSPLATFSIEQHYRLKGTTWFAGNYAKIYGAGIMTRTDGKLSGDYSMVINSTPVNLQSFRRNLRIPTNTKDDGGARLRKTLEQVLVSRSGLAGANVCEVAGDISIGIADQAIVEAMAINSHTLSGIFSTKWSADHALHPGFGFRVEAWTNETTGIWRMLTSDWVQSNGTWTLGIPTSMGYAGKHLRMLYRSYNSYYAPQDQASGKYSWRDPDQYNIPTNFNSGHRYADTDGGSYNGVGELVESAMTMWSRMYWDGGINPVPPSAIKFWFPNTWYDCGDGSGVPWSCANTSGEIWLTSAHGTQADVVTHEMAHQLNNKYWSNKRPAGSGGSHTLTGCYSNRLGMAMREGFANFTAAWVGYSNRNVADGGFGTGRWALDWDAESRVSPPNCNNGWENEVWVARTFWDLHDTRTDGDDILWFIHKGGVPGLYLSNGITNDGDARDMRDYENIYRGAATPGHEGFISDIFNQNRQ